MGKHYRVLQRHLLYLSTQLIPSSNTLKKMKAACHIVSVRNQLKALHLILFFRKDNTYWENAACTVLSGVTVNVHRLLCVALSQTVRNYNLLYYKSLASMGIASEMLMNYRSCTLKLGFKGRFLKCFKKCSLNQNRNKKI